MPVMNDKGRELELVTGTGTDFAVLSIRMENSNTASGALFLQGSNQPGLKAGGTTTVYLNADAGSGQTGMFLLVNQAGTISVKQVFLGAHDSGGSGYRYLRVLTA